MSDIGLHIKQSSSNQVYVDTIEVNDGALTIVGSKAILNFAAGSGHGAGSVTAHVDITSAGSGSIITTAERTKVGNLSVTSAIDLDAVNTTLSAFNGTSQLVQTDGSGYLPALSGVNLTGVVKTTDIGTSVLAPTGSGANLTSLPQHSNSASIGANSDITSITGLTTALSIAQGGTGSTSSANAVGGVCIIQDDGSGNPTMPNIKGNLLTNIPQYWAVEAKGATVTLTDSDFGKIITQTGASANVVYTLPLASSSNEGQEIIILKSTSYQVQIVAQSGNVILDSADGGSITNNTSRTNEFIRLIPVTGVGYFGTGWGVFEADSSFIS